MKKILSLLLALLVSASVAKAVPAASNYTNFPGGLGVGSVSGSTYMVLTGVAEVYKEIPLTSILTGTNGTTALADTAITTGLYVGQARTITNQAAVIFPAETNSPVASIPVAIPLNYRSGGKLVVALQSNISFTAGALSITADCYTLAFNSLTSTTLASGTAVQVPTTAGSYVVLTMTATNSNATFTPGGMATFKLSKAVTSNLARLHVLRAWFVYRPWSLADGI